MADRPRLVVGVTGASGPQLGIALLRLLRSLGTVETHLVLSRAAHRTIELETDLRPSEVRALADVAYRRSDLAASIASGSFRTLGMVLVPCSMRSLAAVAHGYADDVIARAADVTLKERRPLVLVARETPLSHVHLTNMLSATNAGATVLPPVPAYYHRPETIDDLLAHTAGKILDQFGIEHESFRRWDGPPTSTFDGRITRAENGVCS